MVSQYKDLTKGLGRHPSINIYASDGRCDTRGMRHKPFVVHQEKIPGVPTPIKDGDHRSIRMAHKYDFLPDGRLNDDVETTGVDGDNYEAPTKIGKRWDLIMIMISTTTRSAGTDTRRCTHTKVHCERVLPERNWMTSSINITMTDASKGIGTTRLHSQRNLTRIVKMVETSRKDELPTNQPNKDSGGNKDPTPESETSDLAYRNAAGRTTRSMKTVKEFTVLAVSQIRKQE